MLTENDLKQITGLTPDQAKSILTLSNNDTQKEVNEALGNSHGKLDQTFKDILGIDKANGAKTYEFWPEKVKELKTKVDTNPAKAELNALKVKFADLESKLKTGDLSAAQKSKMDELEQSIADKDSVIKKLRDDVTKTATTWEEKLKLEKETNFNDLAISNLSGALMGKTFKESIPKLSVEATLKAEMSKVMGTGKPEKRMNEDGTFDIVFRDDNGLLITDPNNLQEAITGKSLYLKNLEPILNAGKKQPGTGTKQSAKGDKVILDLSGVTNRVDGDNKIRTYLSANGVEAETPEYQEQFSKIREENGVTVLPIKDPVV